MFRDTPFEDERITGGAFWYRFASRPEAVRAWLSVQSLVGPRRVMEDRSHITEEDGSVKLGLSVNGIDQAMFDRIRKRLRDLGGTLILEAPVGFFVVEPTRREPNGR